MAAMAELKCRIDPHPEPFGKLKAGSANEGSVCVGQLPGEIPRCARDEE